MELLKRLLVIAALVLLLAVLTLSMTGTASTPAVQELISRLGHPDPGTRLNAARVLGYLGPEARDAVPALVQAALRDDHPWVRDAAVEALGNMGTAAKAAVPTLIDALQDDDPAAREAAAEALGAIGPDAKDALPALIDALLDDDWWVRQAATQAIKEITSQRPKAPKVLPITLACVLVFGLVLGRVLWVRRFRGKRIDLGPKDSD